MVGQSVLERFIEAITREKKNNNSSHSAIVSRIDEEGTVWVSVAGSEKETPTASVASEVKRGDAVTVEWRNDRLYIAGNYTDPAASSQTVNRVQNVANAANDLAKVAKLEANEAAQAVVDLDENLSQEEIIKRITNNYEWEGIYVDELTGDYYINASYIHAGTMSAERIHGGALKLGGANNVNGNMELYNSSNVKVGAWDNTGFYIGNNYRVDASGYVEMTNGSIFLGDMRDRWLRLRYDGIWSFTAVEGSPDSPYWHGKIMMGSDGFWDIYDNRYRVMYGGNIYPVGHITLHNLKNFYIENTGGSAVRVLQVSGSDNIVVGNDTAGSFNNMNFYVPSGGVFNFNSDISMASGATVDGVDVSALAPSNVNANDFSTLSVANGTDTTLGNTGSLSAGTYILVCTASFANNATGRRVIFLASSTSGSALNRYARVVQAATSGAATQIQLVYPVTITSATTFYLRAYQESGGALNVTNAGIRVIKLHA